MNIISAPKDFPSGGSPVCLAIGFFDGVHLGHQQVIRQAISDAQRCEGDALVITFDRHPNTIVAPARVPLLIYSLNRKLRLLEALGVETVLLFKFDLALSRVAGDQFIYDLRQGLDQIASVCVGANFHFGYQRSGNVEVLKRLGAELGFEVHGLSAVALDGQTISSTRIRLVISEGRFDAASQMLGRPYALCGPVVRGDALGRILGFPTANLDVTGLVLPPPGVYAAHVRVDGEKHRGVLNIGHRPTVASKSDSTLSVEAHLLDFSRDLYGRDLEITPLARLRDERRFSSLEQLKEQIACDIATATGYF